MRAIATIELNNLLHCRKCATVLHRDFLPCCYCQPSGTTWCVANSTKFKKNKTRDRHNAAPPAAETASGKSIILISSIGADADENFQKICTWTPSIKP